MSVPLRLNTLPPQTKTLDHQVAGHAYGGDGKAGLLKHQDGHVLKLFLNDGRGKRELDFYQLVTEEKSDPVVTGLKSFMLKFHGMWSSNGQKYICIEDMGDEFINPSILDVKVGTKTHDPHASQEKISKELAKYPLMAKIGFRILGMKVYDAEKKEYKVYDKYFGRSMTEETIVATLEHFFHGKSEPLARARPAILSQALHQLHAIQQWFQTQTKFAFYSSSLLFMYENDSDALSNLITLQENLKNISGDFEPEPCAVCSLPTLVCDRILQSKRPPICKVYMIDFAHVFSSDSLDHCYLQGLSNLIPNLKKLLEASK